MIKEVEAETKLLGTLNVAMTNKNKRKRENLQQTSKVVTAATESDTLTEVPAKLTKQQKRDIKRAVCNTSNEQRMLTITATNSNGDEVQHHSPEYALDNVDLAEVAAPIKLTKQQRRDAKRAAGVIPEVERASIFDDIGQQTVGKPSVYKRVPVLPALSPFPDMKIDRFLNPKDKHYQKVLETCYDGFVLDNPEAHSDDFHTTFESAFLDMEKSGLFQFDLTQPAGLGTKVPFANLCIIL